MTEQTLALIIKDRQVLLVYNKEQEKWNGPGGNVDEITLPSGKRVQESLKDCIIRETKEEASIILNPFTLEPVADIFCHFERKLERFMHVFRTHDFSGNPAPGREISKLYWCHIDSLPWEKMWAGDIFWWPKLLNGQKIRDIPSIYYNKDGTLERAPEIYFE